MDITNEFSVMVNAGPQTDLFFALQARQMFIVIGEHADAINASTFQPVFATLQAYASDSFVLAVNRLLEREKTYPLQSIHGVLSFLRAHSSELPIREPAFLEQALTRLGYRAGAFGGGSEQTAAVAEALLERLPQASENVALDALKTLRDKRIAHPERVKAEFLPTTTWESAGTLLKIPTEALAVCGAYLSIAFVDSDGHSFAESDARVAAFSTHRLLRQSGIVT